jgi:RHS repeat-associated protein
MTTKTLTHLASLWALVCSMVALGQVNKAGPDLGWTDGQNNGAFSESIPIEVPGFHGLEPHLSVNYNSDSSFGLMGVGWSLSGFSTIERVNYGRGTPSYNGLATVTSDLFLLDGSDLAPCKTGYTSPSCISGGNFTMGIESYNKIFYNTSNDTWSITDRDGTVYVFSPIYQRACSTCAGNFSGNVTWRYGLTSVTNVLGDSVTYTWAQNVFAAQWVGPGSVTYNGNTININYIATPSTAPVAYADGINLEHVHGAIQSIDVQVSGSRARAYQFNYTTSASTDQLLLASMQEFGKDAVISSGTVTSGTSLPARTMTYSGVNANFVGGSSNTTFAAYNTNDIFLSGDINGDGYQDFVALKVNGTTWARTIQFGSASGSFTAGPTDSGMDYTTTGQYFLADVNGDGKMDMIELCGNSTHCGTAHFIRHTWLSNGSAFTSGNQDTNVGYSANSQFLIGDVNGDGKTDMVELYASSPNWTRHMWISNGNGFNSGYQDNNLAHYTTTPSYYMAGDFDGDGKTDMVEIHIDANNTNWDMQTWMSSGSGWVIGYATPNKNMTYNAKSQFFVEDFNGDGKADLVEIMPSGAWWRRTPHVSTGYQFVDSSGWDTAMSYQSTPVDHYLTGDFNGDGHQDMLELSDYQQANTKFWRQLWMYTPKNQESFRPGNDDTGIGYQSVSQFLTMDINGDGLTDMVELYHTAANNWAQHVWLNAGGGVPDLLTSITNESGGTKTIGYTPSSAWSNTNNPPLIQTVTSVTESDGRGWSATTNFSYSGGLYDWGGFKFQGFKTVTTTEPCLSGEASCPYTVETFDQPAHCGSMSPMLSAAAYDGAGNLYHQSQADITYNCAAVPYSALATGHWAYTYQPGSPSIYKRTYMNVAYDSYGNVTHTIDYGDYDVTGDERNIVTSFNYNTSAYLLEHAASETVYAGTTAAGAMLVQTLNDYDCDPVNAQNCSNSAAPTKGLLNRVDVYLNQQSYSNTTSSYLTTKSLYDRHGNATDLYDANNNHTSFAFDSTYGVYATGATNALGQSATMGVDYVCGEETSVTDVNSQVTTTTLDALCRTTQVSYPNGGYVKTQYVNLGSPTAQYVEIDRPGPSGDIYARRYFDGLERSYKLIARGVSADAETDSTFDARGNLSTATTPYFVGGSSVVTTYSYDALNRTTKVTMPDNNTTQTFYGPNANCNNCNVWSVTTMDPLGHKQTDWNDAHGNRIQHDEYVGGSWNSATYTYTLLDHPSTSTDPSGNVITYTVDSLGRTVGINDPDRGLWTYTFDADGNEVAETDALVTPVISYGYDALNRMTSKTTSSDGNTFTWAYDQAQAGYYNIGRLTTKTDPYGSQTYNYDNMGNLVATTRTTDGVAYPFGLTYDNAGRLLSETYPDGDAIGTVAYDVTGHLSSVPNLITSIAYDALERPTQLVNANGTTQSWTYDPNRLWTTGITTKNGATNLQALTYGFDADGNRTSVTSSSSNSTDESWSYGYDELHRLTSAVDSSNSAYSQSFTFNAAGNILSNSRVGSYTYPAQGAGSVQPHAVTAAGGNTYAYNANGQMTSRAGSALSWNGDHLMSSDGSNSYYYGASRELLKLVNGSNTTRYLSDDFEVSPSGTQNKYIMGLAVRVGTGAGNTRWTHSDFNGSIQVQSDGTGTESMRKTYYATGDAIATTGTDSQSKGFTGQRQESSGLTYLHERFYDPLLGRFISTDPLTPGRHGNAGLNRYAYAMNDFVNKEDISGMMYAAGDHPNQGPAPTKTSYVAPAPAPICYYCYAPGPTGTINLNTTAGTRQFYTPAEHHYLVVYHSNWVQRGRLGRLGRKGRHIWHPICYYCRSGSKDLGGDHTKHWGLKPASGTYSAPAPAPKPAGCNWWTLCLNRHWRGAAQAGAVALGAVAVSACIASVVCGTVAGIAIGAGAGMLSTTVNNLTSGKHVSTQQWIIGEAFSGGLGALTMGPFIPGPVSAFGYWFGKFDGAAGDAIASLAVKNGGGIGAQAGKVALDLGARGGFGYARFQANAAASRNGVGAGSAAYGAYLFFGR